MSFIVLLKEGRKNAQAPGDPWRLRLEGLKGKKWDDGIERISTQTVFDKARGLTPGGFRDQVRGYARDISRQTVM
jgi:hypothetical protein